MGMSSHVAGRGGVVTVWRAWDRDDQDGWLEAARWIKDQAERLQAIAETLDTVPGQMADRNSELALILRVSRPKV